MIRAAFHTVAIQSSTTTTGAIHVKGSSAIPTPAVTATSLTPTTTTTWGNVWGRLGIPARPRPASPFPAGRTPSVRVGQGSVAVRRDTFKIMTGGAAMGVRGLVG